MQAFVKYSKSPKQRSFPWIVITWNKFSMIFNKPIGQGSIANFIQTDCKNCEKMSTKDFATVILNGSQGNSNWCQTWQLKNVYHYTGIKKSVHKWGPE